MHHFQALGIVGAIPFLLLLCKAAETHARVWWPHNPWKNHSKKFLHVIAKYRINPYLCSQMRYLNKPSEKIITTESIGSTKLNFLLFHIDGHIVDRLFFAKFNKSNR